MKADVSTRNGMEAFFMNCTATKETANETQSGVDSLGSYEVCVHPSSDVSNVSSRHVSKRASRYIRRARAQALMKPDPDTGKYHRCYWCGHPRIGNGFNVGPADSVHIEKSEYGCSPVLADLEFCGSVWACPVCGQIIRNRRGQEIRQGVENWQAQGGTVLFVTVTTRHTRSDNLSDLLNVDCEAWRKVTSGRPWQDWKKDFQVEGYLRALEINYGLANGWHPHFHFLFFLEREVTQDEADKFCDFLYKRWCDALLKLTDASHLPSSEHGIDVKVIKGDGKVLGTYVSKFMDIGAEVSCIEAKNGRRPEHFNAFQLLDIREPWADARWNEYVKATKGRRSIFFTKGLRDTLGLGEDKDDDQIVAEEAAQPREVVGAVDSLVYENVWVNKKWIEFDQALRCSEIDDWRAATGILDAALGSHGQWSQVILRYRNGLPYIDYVRANPYGSNYPFGCPPNPGITYNPEDIR